MYVIYKDSICTSQRTEYASMRKTMHKCFEQSSSCLSWGWYGPNKYTLWSECKDFKFWMWLLSFIGLINLVICSPCHSSAAKLAVHRYNCYLLLRCYIRFCNNIKFGHHFFCSYNKTNKFTNVKIILFFYTQFVIIRTCFNLSWSSWRSYWTSVKNI